MKLNLNNHVGIRAILLSIFFVIATTNLLKAQEVDANKEAAIRELLALSGSADLGIQVMNQMIASFKEALPNVPTDFWDEFQKEINANELVNLVVPIYDKYFDIQDIEEIKKFYESRVGQKWVANSAAITMESMEVGKKWGEEISKKVVEKLQSEGY